MNNNLKKHFLKALKACGKEFVRTRQVQQELERRKQRLSEDVVRRYLKEMEEVEHTFQDGHSYWKRL